MNTKGPKLLGRVNRIDLANLNILSNKSLDYIATNFEISQFDLKELNPVIKLSKFQYSKNQKTNYIDYINFHTDFKEKNLQSFHLVLNSSFGIINSEVLRDKNQNFSFKINADINKGSDVSDLLFERIHINDTLKMTTH